MKETTKLRMKLIGMRLISIPYGFVPLFTSIAWYMVCILLIITIGLPCWVVTGEVLPYTPKWGGVMDRYDKFQNKIRRYENELRENTRR
jgi:cadmium resistance protein CadD (predicted permease)